jgi:hypothetical protein
VQEVDKRVQLEVAVLLEHDAAAQEGNLPALAMVRRRMKPMAPARGAELSKETVEDLANLAWCAAIKFPRAVRETVFSSLGRRAARKALMER